MMKKTPKPSSDLIFVTTTTTIAAITTASPSFSMTTLHRDVVQGIDDDVHIEAEDASFLDLRVWLLHSLPTLKRLSLSTRVGSLGFVGDILNSKKQLKLEALHLRGGEKIEAWPKPALLACSGMETLELKDMILSQEAMSG